MSPLEAHLWRQLGVDDYPEWTVAWSDVAPEKLPRSGWDYFDHHVQGPLPLQPVKKAHLDPDYLVETKESDMAELAAYEDREEATISPTDDLPKLDPEGDDITDEWGNGTGTPDNMDLEDMEWLRALILRYPLSSMRYFAGLFLAVYCFLLCSSIKEGPSFSEVQNDELKRPDGICIAVTAKCTRLLFA
ncbi:hypothetical protein FOL46_005411 [Perkinsus olseni]|uniref:Uncharacterized protein n=1 Tax=Perkinsus olseni TaxID=32597 RepID=A0A7J6LSB9_PEROL|nr:hypothetical protein FOL46_005411 [Perkinsus olseni]